MERRFKKYAKRVLGDNDGTEVFCDLRAKYLVNNQKLNWRRFLFDLKSAEMKLARAKRLFHEYCEKTTSRLTEESSLVETDALWRKVQELPLEERVVVLLHYKYGVSLVDISVVTERSHRKLGSILKHAHGSLKRAITYARSVL